MPTYKYTAVTRHGQKVRNIITDANKEVCIARLKRNGLIPISISPTLRIKSVKKKPKNFKTTENQIKASGQKKLLEVSKQDINVFFKRLKVKMNGLKKITIRDLRIFTQSFYLLKKAGFNNVHALSTVKETTENNKLKVIIEDILYGVESGDYMYTTMEYYSDIFPFIYINMIKVGELSGSLDKSLEQAIKYLEESDNLTRKLKRILIPNIAMFIGIVAMLFVCIIVGLPIVQDVFKSMGSDEQLPAITLWFAGVVDWLLEYWYLPVMLIGTVIALIWAWIRTPLGRYKFDEFKYIMPIFGKLIYLVDFDRLLKNMYLNIQNGIRIQDSLNLSKSVIKNTVMLAMVDVAINNIYTGKSWIEPFEKARFSNPMTVEMLKIGMQTDLSEMMEKLLELMDMDIDNALQRIMKVLPEVSYALVGMVLIFFVIVVLVPCIQIYMGGFLFDAYSEYM